MTEKTKTIPREAITGIATGLMLMAIFTSIWSNIANSGLQGADHHIVLMAFCVLVGGFFAGSIGFFRQSKNFPKATSEDDIAEKKKSGKWFGIIFGAEGLGIFIAINIVVNLGHPELTIPAIALVVGLHFYPLAKVFKRKIDYYLATWATLVAILGFVFSINKTLAQPGILAFVGIGTAIATSCYGVYMLFYGVRLLKASS